jgi:phosphate transport system substrate-binding protein
LPGGSKTALFQGADWSNAKDFCLIITDAPGEIAYPIMATVLILWPRKPKQPERELVQICLTEQSDVQKRQLQANEW